MNNHISEYGSIENMRENMQMKRFAKEVLLEENYIKFIKSYKFMFWFQLVGIIAGFLIPSSLIFIVTTDISLAMFGLVFGIVWMIICLIISMVMPQGKIYRRFAKWFRKRHSSLDELNIIFYKY